MADKVKAQAEKMKHCHLTPPQVVGGEREFFSSPGTQFGFPLPESIPQGQIRAREARKKKYIKGY